MKIPILILTILAAAMQATAGVADVPHVSAFGTAVTQEKPDLLRWQVTVSNKGSKLSDVSEIHTSRSAAVLDLLSKKSVRPEELQTSGMRFSENREYRGSSWVIDGYLATTRVSFTMRDLDEYRDTWLELSRLEGVSVDSVTWDVSNRVEVQNSTRIEALKSARAKSDQMAAALGMTISEPIVIEEVLAEEPWRTRDMMSNTIRVGAREDDELDAIAPGSVVIRIRVRVVFQLAAP